MGFLCVCVCVCGRGGGKGRSERVLRQRENTEREILVLASGTCRSHEGAWVLSELDDGAREGVVSLGESWVSET